MSHGLEFAVFMFDSLSFDHGKMPGPVAAAPGIVIFGLEKPAKLHYSCIMFASCMHQVCIHTMRESSAFFAESRRFE